MNNSLGGRSLFKGVNTQSIAAMSLFLQYLDDKSFRYMGLERKELEDFHLGFEDGHKIICECKSYLIQFAHIKTILNNIIKHKQFNDGDEILIVCKKVGSQTKNTINNFKYYQDKVTKDLKENHGFKDKHIELLPQLRFWEFGENRERLENTVLLLMGKKLGLWVPNKQLEEIVSDRLIKDIYRGSEKGRIKNKDDFLRKLKERASEIASESGYYGKERDKAKEVKELLGELKNPQSRGFAKAPLKSLTDNIDLHLFALNRFRKKENVNLGEWNNFWEASTLGHFAGTVLDIFKDNMDNPVNREYFFKYVEENLLKMTHPHSWRFLKVDIIDICSEILKRTRDYDKDIFKIVDLLLSADSGLLFYLELRKDERWETEELGKLFLDLYKQTTDENLKLEIVEFIQSTFNLVQDEGKYWHHTPAQVFKIIRDYILEDIEDTDQIENRIKKLSKELVRQYTEFYKKFNSKYKGWELMGFSIGKLGEGYSIQDRHFVDLTLKPAFNKYHESFPDKAWNFIKEECVFGENDVSKNNPDFLNRSVIDILLKEYADSDSEHNAEAKEILKFFIEMRKGIPHKTEIIFQAVRDNENLSQDQKWELVNFQLKLKKYDKLPANIFVEQIASDLASKTYDPALQAITEWIGHEEYNLRHMLGSYGTIDLISKLFESEENFNEGVDLFKTYLSSSDVLDTVDEMQMWDASNLLAQILNKDTKKGLDILNFIWNDSDDLKELNHNQQILITNSIQKISNDDSLVKVYKDFLRPKLEEILKISFKNEDAISSLKEIGPLELILDSSARENLVEFARKLAEAKKFKYALELAQIFILDSNPVQDYKNYDKGNDKEENFNYGKKVAEGEDAITINTVRGRCAWVLQKFVLLDGRDFISKIVPLVERLAFDGNPYVRLQACIPLMELAKIRHTVMPNNHKERFVTIETAGQINDLAFKMLEKESNYVEEGDDKMWAILKGLVHVYGHLRIMTQGKTKQVVNIFLNLDLSREVANDNESYYDKVITEFCVLLIYYAEYREQSTKVKEMEHVFQDQWDSVKNFHPEWFKEQLINLILKGSSSIQRNLVWRFWQLPQEKGANYEESFDIAYRYILYFVDEEKAGQQRIYDHEVFSQIYYFIKDNIDNKFDECFDIWRKCLEIERPALEDLVNNDLTQNISWWPFHWNGRILIKIFEEKGEKEFLKWLEFLTNYSNEVIIANDLNIAVEQLMGIDDHVQQIKRIFTRLVERNPSKYYDYQQKWLGKIDNRENKNEAKN